jgi:hypothetical protein
MAKNITLLVDNGSPGIPHLHNKLSYSIGINLLVSASNIRLGDVYYDNRI